MNEPDFDKEMRNFFRRANSALSEQIMSGIQSRYESVWLITVLNRLDDECALPDALKAADNVLRAFKYRFDGPFGTDAADE